jgi:hypothetical protein
LLSLIFRDELSGPVEPDPTETCLNCEDAKEIKQMGDVPGEPWHKLWTGEMEACPNCS